MLPLSLRLLSSALSPFSAHGVVGSEGSGLGISNPSVTRGIDFATILYKWSVGWRNHVMIV